MDEAHGEISLCKLGWDYQKIPKTSKIIEIWAL
jgi:hypothetical protein